VLLAVLAAVTFPAIRTLQERASGTQCLSNLLQLHVAMMAFANDNSGEIPFGVDASNNNASWGWYLLEGSYLPPLPPAVSGKRLRRHPLFDPGSKVNVNEYTAGSYGINRNLAGPSTANPRRAKIASIAYPAQKLLLFCSGIYNINRSQATTAASPNLYLPGRSANQASSWPEVARRDAIEGRHGGKIHTVSVTGIAETWIADQLPVTAERWEK